MAEGIVIKRECDRAMARKKRLLPCDKDCKHCMASIETTSTGERRHCTDSKNINLGLDMRAAMADMKVEPFTDPALKKRQLDYWTSKEDDKLLLMIRQGFTPEDVAKEIGRTVHAVRNRLARLEGKR